MLEPRHALLPASLLALLSACGGGGDGSSAVEGLEPPSQVSVVVPAEDTPRGAPVRAPASASDFPAGSDFVQDAANVHVYDPSIEPLQLVNEILCLVQQTAAHELVNAGPYTAQVNATKCAQGQDTSSSETGQSSSNVDEFQIWTVNSERASSTAPHQVQFWIPEEDGDIGALTIFVDMVLTHGVEALLPFGEFVLNFAGALDAAGVALPVFGGTLESIVLESGHAGFLLFFKKGDVDQAPLPGEHAEETGAMLAVTPDRTRGNARVRQLSRFDHGQGDSGLVSDEYLVAFDETHFLRAHNGAPPVAFDRHEFHQNVWRYNLYDAASGERIELESGFGFRTQAGDYGWIGYWGMWLPEGVDVASGEVVTREVFGEPGADYTLFRAPGKLIRHTKHQIDLAELGGEDFDWWSFDFVLGTSTNYRVEYDTGLARWVKTGVHQPGSPDVDPIDPPEPIDTAAIGFLNMWSESLGGPTAYVHGETFLTYYVQEFVDGSDPELAGGDLELFGLVQCLRPEVTAAEAELGDVYLPDAPDVASPHALVFQAKDLGLYLDESATGGGLSLVGLGEGEVPDGGPYAWGLRTGPLVTSTAGLVSPYDVWNVDEFYIYETGPHPWNRFAGLIDATQEFVEFDPPIRFDYVHATASDRNGDPTFDGRTFFLNYGGPGELWGLPQEGVDMNGDGQSDRWYPIVNLADGTFVGPTGTEYAVKALEVEQTLEPDPAYAGTLDLDGAENLVLPDVTIYTAPDIGPAPVVDGPPRVVEGEVVGGGE